MTPKERWLAALRFQPVDHLPFWPKLSEAYPCAQAEPFRSMTVEALHDWLGSDPHVGLPGCIREVHVAGSLQTSTQNGFLRTVYTIRGRSCELHCRWDEASRSWHPVRFPVQGREDLEIMREFYEDSRPELDRSGLQAARARFDQIGGAAVTTESIGESPLMYWVEWLAGVENAHLLLADYPAEVEALFAALHQVLLRRAEILADCSPADLIYLVENTSTTLISPTQYRRYCVPPIEAYGRLMQESGRLLLLHMCGLLRDLLPDLARLPVAGFEAFTSPPLGNTTLLEGRAACPDKALVGGTNAVLWTRSAGEIIAQLERDLEALPHHRGLVVTSAGVMPPRCPPQTIRAVRDWVVAYPCRMG